jgi:hypothetical protein
VSANGAKKRNNEQTIGIKTLVVVVVLHSVHRRLVVVVVLVSVHTSAYGVIR